MSKQLRIVNRIIIPAGVFLGVAIVGFFYYKKDLEFGFWRTLIFSQEGQKKTISVESVLNCSADFSNITVSQKNSKLIRVSDGKIGFSFDVPDYWLIETRHSGEIQQTIGEMRNFLATNYDGNIRTNAKLYGDYLDISWADLQKMTDEEVKNSYERKDNAMLPFPNASVAADDHIWYTDIGRKQIDFYVFSNFEERATIFNKIYSAKGASDPNGQWCAGMIDGNATDVITFPVAKDMKGNDIASKAGTGGQLYFVKLNAGKDMFVIYKQARAENQFEKDFLDLIKSIRFIHRK